MSDLPEEKLDDIIDKLTNEGQLIRNTGTNSIKSVNTRLDKFAIVFDSINKNILEQNTILLDSLNIEIERKRTEDLNRVEPTLDTRDADPAPRNSNDNTSPGGLSEMGSSISAAIGGFIGSSLGSISSAFKFGLGATILVGLGPTIVEFFQDFITAGLEDLIGSSNFTNSFGDALGTAGSFALMGKVLGGRFGMMLGLSLGVGKALYNELDKIFNLDSTISSIANSFGIALSEDSAWIDAIGIAIGFGIVSLLKKGAVRLISTAFAAAGPEILGRAAAEKGGGAAIRTGIGALRTRVATARPAIINGARSFGQSISGIGGNILRSGGNFLRLVGPQLGVTATTMLFDSALEKRKEYANSIFNQVDDLTEGEKNYISGLGLSQVRTFSENPELVRDFLNENRGFIKEPLETSKTAPNPILPETYNMMLDGKENNDDSSLRNFLSQRNNPLSSDFSVIIGNKNNTTDKMLGLLLDRNLQPMIIPKIDQRADEIKNVDKIGSTVNSIVYAPVTSSPVTVVNGGSNVSNLTGVTSVVMGNSGGYGGLPQIGN